MRQEDEFRIGGLPEQEVAEPHFSARPDHQIRIGHLAGIEMGGKHGFVDLIGIDAALSDLAGDAPRRPGDFVAPAVVEGHDHAETGIRRRLCFGLADQGGNVLRQPLAGSDHLNPHPLAMEAGEIAANEHPQQPEKELDLGGRARPVLRGEAEQRQVADAEVGRRRDGPADGLDPAPMAFAARQAPRLRPAAVAIHDDRDMGAAARRSAALGSVTTACSLACGLIAASLLDRLQT